MKSAISLPASLGLHRGTRCSAPEGPEANGLQPWRAKAGIRQRNLAVARSEANSARTREFFARDTVVYTWYIYISSRICKLYVCNYIGTRLTGGREEISTPSIRAFCFSADLQWSEHPSPFWTFHAAVPLVKAASTRNYRGKYMFFSCFAKHPNYLFQWMKPLLKVQEKSG